MATITVLQIDVLTEEVIELQLVKQNLMFTNHVPEGWELNLLPSHSWCNALGCVYSPFSPEFWRKCLLQISYAVYHH